MSLLSSSKIDRMEESFCGVMPNKPKLLANKRKIRPVNAENIKLMDDISHVYVYIKKPRLELFQCTTSSIVENQIDHVYYQNNIDKRHEVPNVTDVAEKLPTDQLVRSESYQMKELITDGVAHQSSNEEFGVIKCDKVEQLRLSDVNRTDEL